MNVAVVGLGAWCDLVPHGQSDANPGGASFDVQEFAVLDDGRRLTLHADRGWTTWLHSSGQSEPLDPWAVLTVDGLEQDVLNVVLPDDEATEEKHPWEWLRELLQKQGIEASSAHLKAVPYTVEFSDRLLQRLSSTQTNSTDDQFR